MTKPTYLIWASSHIFVLITCPYAAGTRACLNNVNKRAVL